MDIGEIPVHLPTLSAINDQLINLMKDQYLKHLDMVLQDISETRGIPKDQLTEKYMTDTEFGNFGSVSVAPKKSRRKLDPKIRCCARTSNRTRCSRKRKTERFCGSHEHSRPYGEVEDEEDDESSTSSASTPRPLGTPVVKKKPVVRPKVKIETKEK